MTTHHLISATTTTSSSSSSSSTHHHQRQGEVKDPVTHLHSPIPFEECMATTEQAIVHLEAGSVPSG
jgi:hypothetical protein